MSEDGRTGAAEIETGDAVESAIGNVSTDVAEIETDNAAESTIGNVSTDAAEIETDNVAESVIGNISTDAAEIETDNVAESAIGNKQKTDSEILKNNKIGNKITSDSKSITIILSVLLAVSIAVTVFAYVMLRREESKAFEDQWDAEAEKMKIYMEVNVDAAFASLDGLSILTTSVVKRFAEETEYPPGFINIPDVAQILGEAMDTNNALVIAYLPKVLPENYDLWESYSRTHSTWVAEEQPGGPVNVTPEINSYIWEYVDYDWEFGGKRRLIDEIGDGTPQIGLRGNESSRKLKKNRAIERPSDCSGSEEQRRRDLATEDRRNIGKDVGGRKLVSRGLNVSNSDDSLWLEGDDDDDNLDRTGIEIVAPRSDEFHTPVWQLTPVPVLNETDPFVNIINYNLADRIVFKQAIQYIEESRRPVFLDVCDQSAWFLVNEHRDILQTVIVYPVFDDFSENKMIVGYYAAIIPWTEFFKSSRDTYSNDMIVVMKNSCGEVFSVKLTGKSVTILGEYDAHDPKFDNYRKNFTFAEKYNKALESELVYGTEVCVYDVYIYPTEK